MVARHFDGNIARGNMLLVEVDIRKATMTQCASERVSLKLWALVVLTCHGLPLGDDVRTE